MRIKNVDARIINKSISALIIINPILDLLVSLTKRFTESGISIATIFRGGTFTLSFIFITMYLVVNRSSIRSNKQNKILFCLHSLAIFSVSIFLITRPSGYMMKNFIVEINEKVRILYFPYLFAAILVLDNLYSISASTIAKSMKITLFIYSFLIVFPFVTNTDFNSYLINDLSGTVGWLYGANEVGLILGLLINIYLFDYIDDNLFVYDYVGIFIAIMAIILIGTKGSLLMMFVFILLIAYRYLEKLSGKQWFIAIFALISFSIILILVLPAGRNMLFLISTQGIDKIFATMLSGRVTFLNISWDRYTSAPFYVAFSGIGVQFLNSNNVYSHAKMIEMDFFEVFIMHGVLMVPVVYSPFIYASLKIREIITISVSLSYKQIIGLVTLIATFILSFMIGHVVGSPSVSIYVVLWILLLKKESYIS